MEKKDTSVIDSGNAKMNERNPTARDLFPDEFIRNHTNFGSTDEFIFACEELMGAKFNEIDGVDETFTIFIREHTEFLDFSEMFTKAASEWVVSCFRV